MSEYVTRPKRYNDLLHVEKTEYQDLLIADTYEYGKVLMLDGAYQLTERDEFTYSEMMAHVPLCAHKNPEKVLIIGGGDGAIMREVLKHDCVKKCTLIDIDKRVAECSQEFLPFAGDSYKNPRADFKPMDAMKFIKETSEKFDVVIIDSTDPVDFAAGLFQSSFYSDVKKVMNDGAMLSELTESPFTDTDLMTQAINEMRKVFSIVKLYWGVVPTYPSGMWTYGVASLKDDPAVPVRDVKDTRWYTNEIHKNSFVLPPFLKDLIRKD